jgi:hypothetical protein
LKESDVQMASGRVWFSALMNSAAFALGPGAAALLISWLVTLNPPEFAHPSQAAALQIAVLGPLMALGALGVFVSIFSRMTPDPLAPNRRIAALWPAAIAGLVLGLAVLGLDFATGFSNLVARSLGIASIHITFPASLYVYAAGAIAVECLYRIVPLSLVYGVVARLLLKGRGEGAVFWSLAALTSLIEPLSQAGLARGAPGLVLVLFASIWLFNVSEAALWRRYGWTSLIVSRVVFYLVWHVALGPVLANG